MQNLLVVNSSPNSETSVSRELTNRFAEQWALAHPQAVVVHRDVGLAPPPHLDADTIGAFYTPPEARTDEQRRLVALSDSLVDELEAADLVVIGAPMHNFGITSGLKTWIDHVARVGRTFHYVDGGPRGLLGGKKVIVLASRGGFYGPGTAGAPMDQQIPSLRTALSLIGLDDIEFVLAEGTAMGTQGRDAAVRRIPRLVAAPADRTAARATELEERDPWAA